MKRVLAFGASNSRNSINQQLAQWVAALLDGSEVIALDLNDYEMPIYSIDREQESGIPALAHQFKEVIKSVDAIIISLAEHNGSYTAAFKNITDWVSRIEKGTWGEKPILLLSTSPGGRGGQGVLSAAKGAFPHQGAEVVGSFSLPSFHQNFDKESGITDEGLKATLNEQLKSLQTILST